MAKRSDESITITEASHRVPCSVKFLRNHVRRGNINEHRLPTGHLIFYEAEIVVAGDDPVAYLRDRPFLTIARPPCQFQRALASAMASSTHPCMLSLIVL